MDILVHVLCTLAIVLLSLIGSIFSIYFYAKKKPITVGAIFIITLASLDIFASAVITPLYPLILDYVERREKNNAVFTESARPSLFPVSARHNRLPAAAGRV